MDVLVVLRWARTTLLEDWETADGMAFHSESDHAHWKALVELCEER
jgi:quinol monooxygenase YgiN